MRIESFKKKKKERLKLPNQKRLKLPIFLSYLDIGPLFIIWHLQYCPCQFWPLWYCLKPRPILAYSWLILAIVADAGHSCRSLSSRVADVSNPTPSTSLNYLGRHQLQQVFGHHLGLRCQPKNKLKFS